MASYGRVPGTAAEMATLDSEKDAVAMATLNYTRIDDDVNRSDDEAREANDRAPAHHQAHSNRRAGSKQTKSNQRRKGSDIRAPLLRTDSGSDPAAGDSALTSNSYQPQAAAAAFNSFQHTARYLASNSATMSHPVPSPSGPSSMLASLPPGASMSLGPGASPTVNGISSLGGDFDGVDDAPQLTLAGVKEFDTPRASMSRSRDSHDSHEEASRRSPDSNDKLKNLDGVDVQAVAEPPEDEPEVKYTHLASSLLPGPPCVRNILGNELCERFSYYGLRAILVLFFHERLGWSKDNSISMSSYSAALAYFLPLLGGYLSDSHFGKYNTILRFSVVYVFGSVLLACSAIHGTAWLSILGLIFIGFGTGGIKPCVSSFGADQFTSKHITGHEQLKKREHDISSFFHFFYFSINLGSVGSFIITPLLKQHFGYAIAFAVPAVLLTVAIFVFWSARKQYYRAPIKGSVLTQLGHVYKVAFTHRHHADAAVATASPPPVIATADEDPSLNGTTTVAAVDVTPAPPTKNTTRNWLDAAYLEPGMTTEHVENAKALWRVLPIFSVLPVFWMLFDQQSSSWTLQADEMQLHGLQAEQVGVVNPVLIMILLPIFDRYIYPAAEKCFHFSPLKRIGFGMVISMIAFVLSAGVQYLITSSSSKVSVTLQLPQIFLISVAEILVSVTGLEFAYTQATPALKSSITAIFLITTAIGNVVTGVLYTALAAVMTETMMYLLFAGLMFLNFFLFLWVAHGYQAVVIVDEKVRTEDEEQETEEERVARVAKEKIAALSMPDQPAKNVEMGKHTKRPTITATTVRKPSTEETDV